MEWGTDGTFPNTANDVRGALAGRLNKRTHKASISGVTGGATINYRIVSGGSVFPQDPITIPSNPLVSAATLLLGSVTYEDGSAGRECLVYMRVSQITFGAPLYSLYVNGMTDGGSYTLDITNIRQDPANVIPGLGPFNNNFNNALTYDVASQNATIEIIAGCDGQRYGSASVTSGNADTAGGNYINVDVVVLEPLAAPTFSVDSVTVNEGDGTATTLLRLNPVSDVETSIEWRTEDGTAVSTEDYTAQASTTETFAAGQATTSISVPITDDALDEADESITIIIGNATGGAEVGSGGTVTIEDNDANPTVSVEAAKSVIEGNSGTTAVDITVNVAPVNGADVTVTFSTSDGTATSGDNDFVTASTVVIPAGDTSGTATVDVNGDTNYEADEDFTVTFSATSHGDDLTVNPNVTTVTIVNDDAPTANDDSDTTDEDTELTSSGSVLDNDSAPAAGASLTAALDQAISEGALTLNADGTYTFDPRGAFDDLQVSESRDATFTYMAVDSRGTTPDSASATVTITVGGVNDAPVANGDPYQVQQGVVLDLVALGLNVLSNDTDVDHPTPIVAVLVDDLTPGTGILTLGNFNATSKEWDGTFVYDADGFSGVTQFTYMAQDPLGANSVKATVTLIGAPAFSIADVTVDEDPGVATLTITLDPVAPAPSSVDYSTTDGSAVAPGDYTGAAATRVDFGTGESTKQIQVPIIDDAIDELVEKFQVVLSNAQGGGDPVAVVSTVADSADVTINDNDDPPVLTVEPAKSLTEGDSGTTDVDITVSLSAVSGLDVTVKYDTVDVTAQDSDNDFTFVLDGMLTIPAGETQTSTNGGTEKITVLGDTKYEADETFKVVFHDAVNATLGTTSTVTIVNDDAPTANANSDTTDEDTELTSSGSVLDNDSTPAAGTTLTAALDQAISEGALTLNADGTYTFDPRGAFDDLQVGESRDATFTYMAVDSRGTTPDSAPATVTINVDGVNDAPVAMTTRTRSSRACH